MMIDVMNAVGFVILSFGIMFAALTIGDLNNKIEALQYRIEKIEVMHK